MCSMCDLCMEWNVSSSILSCLSVQNDFVLSNQNVHVVSNTALHPRPSIFLCFACLVSSYVVFGVKIILVNQFSIFSSLGSRVHKCTFCTQLFAELGKFALPIYFWMLTFPNSFSSMGHRIHSPLQRERLHR